MDESHVRIKYIHRICYPCLWVCKGDAHLKYFHLIYNIYIHSLYFYEANSYENKIYMKSGRRQY